MTLAANKTIQRLQQLATLSEEPDKLTRTFMTTTHQDAAKLIREWMLEAGMSAHIDAIGNVIGRYEGTATDAPALVLGSHYDTVRNAGIYDGLLGIVVAIACIEALKEQQKRFEFPLEVAAFSEEEGVRFGATLLGSLAYSGQFNAALLNKTDTTGTSMASAIIAAELNPSAIPDIARRTNDVFGYYELHIEQGPVLAAQNLPVSAVSAIAGASRFRITFNGKAGHAGTVPMQQRQDALAGAAEAVLQVEQRCSSPETLVGTVGEIEVANSAVNTIPGSATFSLDIRAESDTVRESAAEDLMKDFAAIASRRGLTLTTEQIHNASSCHCDSKLTQMLITAIESEGVKPLTIMSGAGHDAMAISAIAPISMLFVRSGNGGISHHPDEAVDATDIQVAQQVTLNFIEQVGAEYAKF